MYAKMQFDSFFREKVQILLNQGMFKIDEGGKLAPMSPKGILKSPWLFTNYDARRKYCSWWNAIYCGVFKVIPSFCRFNCWKTVVYPRTVLETFQLSDVLRSLNLPSKCGADLRQYTYHAWGGYIYGDSLESGLAYYKTIRRAVDEYLSPEVEIILKRGCTEMERLRPSDTWDDYTDDEKALEFQLNDLFHFQEQYFRQSAWLQRQIKESWILRAIEIGDPTVPQTLALHSNGVSLEDLIVKSITYHNTPAPEKGDS